MKAKTWGRILVYLGFAILLAFGIPTAASSHTQDDPLCTNLVTVGQGQSPISKVGTVCVWNDETNLSASFELGLPGAVLRTTSVSVSGDGEGKPASWEYTHGALNSKTDTFVISLDVEGLSVGESARIWGHAVFSGAGYERARACICPIPLRYEVQTTRDGDGGGGGGRRRRHHDDTTTTMPTVAAVTVTTTTIPVSTTVAVQEAPVKELPFTGIQQLWLILGSAVTLIMLGSALILLA